MRRPVCLLVLLFCAAVWTAVLLSPPEPAIGEKAEGRYVTLLGTVEGKEYAVKDPGDDLYIRLTLKDVRMGSRIPEEAAFEIKRDDKVLCLIEEDPGMQQEWAREGASVRVRGRIRLFRKPSNDGEFDSFMYYTAIGGYLFTLGDTHILAYNGDCDPVKNFLYSLRNYLSEKLDQIYGDIGGKYGKQCASVMKAMLLGQNSLVDPQVKQQYQAAGIVHVICVSGLHISLIGSGIYTFLRRCRAPLPLSCAVSVFFLYLYGVMTGMHTSCFRALVMFVLRVGAKAAGRTYDMLTAMAVAAALLLIEEPCYLFHSGFLFSFSAVAAACILAPVLPKAAKPLAIPLFTIPVQLCFYYTFPLYSVVLNVIVIFLAPFVMAGGGISLFLGAAADIIFRKGLIFSIFCTGARAAGMIPVMILGVFERLCIFTEKLPLSTVTAGRPPLWVTVVYYLLIAAAVINANMGNAERKRDTAFRAFCCVTAVFLIFRIRYEPPFALYMLDVGQGDGLCIRKSDENGNCTILIDGGSSSKKSIGKNIEIPFLKYHGISKIDYCIMTHDDLDHCSGLLELLEQSDSPGGVRIGYLGLPSVLEERKGETYKRIEETAARKGIPVSYLYRGMTFRTGELELTCMHPAPEASYEDANEYSVVLMLSYNRFKAVLTGDLEGQGETDMLDHIGDTRYAVDVLKAAHHGSKGGTTEQFLDKISSKTALISCGKGNRYGHPAPETVRRIREAGMEIYDTREDGQITVSTDGRGQYSIHTFY